ncbi:alpha/beta hydrolase [Streptomyces pathocidini]|uniref:Alpha/beta hydrolase n=1 Tax=Streptomyces pathocidini TaxID=1650571 RepID=A0ABW7UNN0_9ACTN
MPEPDTERQPGPAGRVEGAADRAGAAEQAAEDAEMAAAMAHPVVPPDATVPYGEHPDQIVDFHAPRDAGTGPAPLVVFLHGGAWRAPYDRHHCSPLAAHLAAHGYAVAAVEYRRGQAAEAAPPLAGRWPDTLDDLATAIDRIPTLVAELAATAPFPWGRVDARRLVLSGHSAGGHLALWAAARHRQPADSPWHLTSPPPVRGVVALAPIADFTSARELGVCSDAVVQFLGGPGEFEARRPYADPATTLPTGIATTIVHGTTDITVPPQVSTAFADAAEAAGEPVRLVLLDRTGHFPLIDPAAPAARTVLAEIERLAPRPPSGPARHP